MKEKIIICLMIIGIEKFDKTKILIDTDDKLVDEVSLEIILILWVIKDGDKFYLQIFLEVKH